jgi:hypothetical protein
MQDQAGSAFWMKDAWLPAHLKRHQVCPYHWQTFSDLVLNKLEFAFMRVLLNVLLGLVTVLPCLGQEAASPAAPAGPTEQQTNQSSDIKDRLNELATKYGAVAASGEIVLKPRPGTANLHFADDARGAYRDVARTFGINVTFDESAPTRRVRLDLDNVDFQTAMDTLADMTRTFWAPVAPDEVIVAADTSAKRKELEHMVLRTFYFPGTSSPQELTEMMNVLRTVFEIRFVTIQANTSSIMVRAPQRTLDAAAKFLDSLSLAKPQVLLDVQVFEINHSMLRTVGINLPLQFQIFNLPSAALAALGAGNLQNIISQLLTAGTLNPNSIAALAGLVGQLQNQQSALLANPLATFGGGLTLFGIGIPPLTVNFSLNESRVNHVQSVTLRAQQGDAATLHIGDRYPIPTNSYSNLVGNQPVLGLPTGVIPAFQYEDLGLTLKAKPQAHGTESVTLDIELELRALGAQQFNGVPVIQNRSYKSMIRVKDGEAAVVTGMMSSDESKSLSGPPGLSGLPVLGRAVSNHSTQRDESELLVIITPHIVGAPEPQSILMTLPPQ